MLPNYLDARLNEGDTLMSDLEHESKQIVEGFLHPQIGWVVEDVPGLSPTLVMDYRNQWVPPLLLVYMDSAKDGIGILFSSGADRGLCSVSNRDSISFTTDGMYQLRCKSDAIVDLNSQIYHLEKTKLKSAQVEQRQ